MSGCMQSSLLWTGLSRDKEPNGEGNTRTCKNGCRAARRQQDPCRFVMIDVLQSNCYGIYVRTKHETIDVVSTTYRCPVRVYLSCKDFKLSVVFHSRISGTGRTLSTRLRHF